MYIMLDIKSIYDIDAQETESTRWFLDPVWFFDRCCETLRACKITIRTDHKFLTSILSNIRIHYVKYICLHSVYMSF